LLLTTHRILALLNVNQSKHYCYHWNHNNNTKECMNLKDKIEVLMQVEWLQPLFEGNT